MTSGEFLALIGRLGLTQTAAARLLGVGERTLRGWVARTTKGRRSVPDMAVRFLTYLERTETAPAAVFAVLDAKPARRVRRPSTVKQRPALPDAFAAALARAEEVQRQLRELHQRKGG